MWPIFLILLVLHSYVIINIIPFPVFQLRKIMLILLKKNKKETRTGRSGRIKWVFWGILFSRKNRVLAMVIFMVHKWMRYWIRYYIFTMIKNSRVRIGGLIVPLYYNWSNSLVSSFHLFCTDEVFCWFSLAAIKIEYNCYFQFSTVKEM